MGLPQYTGKVIKKKIHDLYNKNKKDIFDKIFGGYYVVWLVKR